MIKETDKKGFYGIGCLNMKTEVNYGTLFRSALIFKADFVFLIGRRFKKMSSDTLKSYNHIPLYEYLTVEEFYNNMPYGCRLIGVEQSNISIPIQDFQHPKQACYLLGSEDNGLPKYIQKKCYQIVHLPGKQSLNVAVAGSIVMFHRKLNS